MNILSAFEDINAGPVWFFTAARSLSESEQTAITTSLHDFFTSWDAHGKPVVARMQIVSDQMVVVVADETIHPVTGCSKDKLQHLFQGLSRSLGVDLFQRMLIPIRQQDMVQFVHWNDIAPAIDKGTLNKTDQFLDTAIMRVEDLREKLWQPLEELLVVL